MADEDNQRNQRFVWDICNANCIKIPFHSSSFFNFIFQKRTNERLHTTAHIFGESFGTTAK